MPTSVEASIAGLFDRLEKKHGQMLVSHTVGYITAAKGGLTESELEDLLCLDNRHDTEIMLDKSP